MLLQNNFAKKKKELMNKYEKINKTVYFELQVGSDLGLTLLELNINYQ